MSNRKKPKPLFRRKPFIGPEESASRIMAVLANNAGLEMPTLFRTMREWDEYLAVRGLQAHLNDEDDVQQYYIDLPCEEGEHPAVLGWLCRPKYEFVEEQP